MTLPHRRRRAVRPFGPWTAALLLAGCCATAHAAPDAAREWTLSTAVGPAYALGKAGERWAALIGEGGGAPIVRTFPGAVLAARDPAREFGALRDGAADLAVGSTLYWSLAVSELAVVGLPWLAPEARQVEALVSGTMKERLDAALERARVIPLAYAALPHRALATTAREVRGPADLAGLRLRYVSTPYLTQLYTALGALPQAMSFADAQAAFQAGGLDGQEGTPATFAAARLDALGVRHVLLWGAVAEVAIFAANRSAWNGLTEAERTRVKDAAQKAARELPAAVEAENERALAELQRRGVTVTRLTESGRALFAAAARSTYDKWAAIAGEELARAAEAAVKAAP